LPKEPCKHSAKVVFGDGEEEGHYECIKCGIELVAEWKAK
jgi:hypothetical protein